MAGSRRQAQPLGGARHGIFAARVIYAESLAGHDDAAALAAQRFYCAADTLVCKVFGVGAQKCAGGVKRLVFT